MNQLDKLPKPVKGLIIENDWNIPGQLKGLLKDNPQVFQNVQEAVNARHWPDAVTNALVSDVNTVIVSSTFIYKDQLEDSVRLIYSLGRPIYIIAEYIGAKINDWIGVEGKYNPHKSGFDNYDVFMTIIKNWVNAGLVFELAKDHKNPTVVVDDLHGWYHDDSIQERPLWTVDQVLYSEKYNMVYPSSEGEQYCIRLLKHKAI
jgi:hypothetical protein